MLFPSNLEADYQSDLGPEKIRVLRQVCALAVILTSCFGVLDYWAMPSAYREVWEIRGTMVMVSMFVIGWAKYWPQIVLSRYTFVTCSIYLASGLGVVSMIALADPKDMAWSSYYVGVMLSCAALPLSYLALLPTLALGTTYVIAYIFVAVVVQGMLRPQYCPLLMMNCFFLVSANIIGITVAKIRERYSRDVYLLRHALQRDVETTKEAKRQSDFLAEHDTLTRMPNRICFLRRLEAMMEHANDTHATATVLFIDLDDFKPINDTYGHRVGDIVLTVVSERIRSCVREVDAVARLGGDEFVVAVELDRRHRYSIDRLRQNLADAISSPITIDGKELSVSASIGTATHPGEANTASELIHAADGRMYEAKRKREVSPGLAMPRGIMHDFRTDSAVSHSW